MDFLLTIDAEKCFIVFNLSRGESTTPRGKARTFHSTIPFPKKRGRSGYIPIMNSYTPITCTECLAAEVG